MVPLEVIFCGPTASPSFNAPAAAMVAMQVASYIVGMVSHTLQISMNAKISNSWNTQLLILYS